MRLSTPTASLSSCIFRINHIEVEVIPCQHIAYVLIGGQLCHIVAESGHIGGLCFLTAFRLEGGVAALAVGSGAAAVAYAIQNLAFAGDHVVAAKNIYGGTYNLLAHTLEQFLPVLC